MTFYSTRLQTGENPVPLYRDVSTIPWGLVELVVPQSYSAIRVEVTGFPLGLGVPNWKRFDPGSGRPRQFVAGSYAIGKRRPPKALVSRPFTINRPEFVVEIPPPVIQEPWNIPPGNSANVPEPGVTVQEWALYLWLASGIKISIFDEGKRWRWIRD